ncbi:hypothetical protein MBLNU230_g5292t1 [Neophaeotheca triangularis]
MFTNTDYLRRRPSRSASKRKLRALVSRTKPGLALDTSVSRHRGQIPEQVLPVHKRVKGLRPAPLDLTDISPSDQTIPIGLAVPSAELPNHESSPQSGEARGQPPLPQKSSLRYAQEASTPTIVITPAEETFGFNRSPEELQNTDHYRPASSVYSRYTNGAARQTSREQTPPVPPLPLFANGPKITEGTAQHTVRDSNLTTFKEGVHANPRNATLSICTEFDEETPLTATGSAPARESKRFTTQSMLPTPQRSNGWWNLITSPFSAGSNAFFWRSPPPVEHNDEASRSLLADGTGMGRSEPVFQDRAPEDDELRSAPPVNDRDGSLENDRPAPKRSLTAPGALDSNAPTFNIYRIPSQGEAAAYYDQSQPFKSPVLVGAGGGASASFFEDESPLDDSPLTRSELIAQEVWGEEFRRAHGSIAPSSSISNQRSVVDKNIINEYDNDKSPFADKHAAKPPPTETQIDRNMFSTPAAEEMATPAPARPTQDRSNTQTTAGSIMSPMSATPKLESAHMATLAGPGSANNMQREVTLTPSRAGTTPPSTTSRGLGVTTMKTQPIVTNTGSKTQSLAPSNPDPEKPKGLRPTIHTRQSSHGLGITSTIPSTPKSQPSTLITEKPSQPSLHKAPTLRTDRFGQLRVCTEAEADEPWIPWWRRFLWVLIALSAFLLLLLLVLLIVFIPPRQRGDMPVQARWLNLTGFPALPTGIATVVGARKQEGEESCGVGGGLWGCGVPAAADGDDGEDRLPSWRFEIRFRNGTVEDKSAVVPVVRDEADGDEHGEDLRKRHGGSLAPLWRRGAWEDRLYDSWPSPPGEEDRLFMGKEVDGVDEPYEGEETPFFLSLLDVSDLEPPKKDLENRYQLPKRNDANPYPYPSPATPTAPLPASDSASASPVPDPSASASASASPSNTALPSPSKIPSPPIRPNGQPAPALLYPLVRSQPLLLYNRGQKDEHYGFHTYYDRTIFAKGFKTSTPNSGNSSNNFNNNNSNNSNNANANNEPPQPRQNTTTALTPNTSPRNANAICTLPSTRLLVKIWTRRGTVAELGTAASGADDGDDRARARESSAMVAETPGSFPYPVTVVLDRGVGGRGRGRGRGERRAYCHGLDGEGRVVEGARGWVGEAVGGGGWGGEGLELVSRELGMRGDAGGRGCECRWSSGE